MLRKVFKRIIQIFWYTVEVISVDLIFVLVTNYINPCTSGWEYFERGLMGYTIYQIAIYLILENCNDIRKDSYLALLTNYKNAELYLTSKEPYILNNIMENIAYQLKFSTLNDDDLIKEYHGLEKYIKHDNITAIQYKIILFEHMIEETSLIWKYSILLRLIK